MNLNVLMAYGIFVFMLPTLAYEELRRSTQYRHAANNVVGARPQRQYLGPGDDTITITGRLYPQFKGTPLSLDALRAMAEDGKAWPLVCGYGRMYGAWIIENIDEGQTHFSPHGAPLRYEFSITFKRADASLIESLGMLKSSTQSLFGM